MMETWIYNCLSENIGAKLTVYPDHLPQGIDAPYLIFSIVNVNPDDTKDGQNMQTIDLQVSMFNDDTLAETIGWANELKTDINNTSYVASGAQIQSIRFVDRDWQYMPDGKLYLVDDIYRLRIWE